MKLAVIVVEYNDAENTVKYVQKLTSYKNIQKIVIVDNFSTDSNTMNILNKISDEKVVVLQSERNGGYNYGNNFGIKYLESTGEFYDCIMISNPDIEIEEKAIEKCLETLENNEDIAVVAPRMFNSQNNPIRRSSWKIRTFLLDVIHSTRILELVFYSKLRKGEYSKEDYKKELLEVEAISGSCFFIKSGVLKKIGKFDDNVFLFYEEDILAKQIKELGYKIISINDIKFIHHESQTIGKTFSYYKKMRQLYKSKMYYQKKYNGIKTWQVFLFKVLQICRSIELIIEIPLRKLLKK